MEFKIRHDGAWQIDAFLENNRCIFDLFILFLVKFWKPKIIILPFQAKN